MSIEEVNEEIYEEMEITSSKSTTELFEAIESNNVDAVKSLVQLDDCDVFFQDNKTGTSPLMVAAAVGNTEIVKILLQEGAPWNAVDRDYKCAGDYALMKNNQECIDVLLHHATISEILLGKIKSKEKKSLNADYLKREVEYTGDKLMDSDGLAVMMDWEKDLMYKHAAFICHADQQELMDDSEPKHKSRRKNIRVLNVGFGMGIVDSIIQSHNPEEHYIIEAHPQVYEKMQKDGWTEKRGVKVFFGRWQDALENIGDVTFDGIFFDTYAEDDLDLKEFHTFLPKILTQKTGRYSFYNGLCPDNAFFHAVACEVTKLELANFGLECQYESVKVDVADPKIWEGVTKRYWYFDTYYLPKCFYKIEEN